MTKKKYSGAEIFTKSLKDNGIDTIFGYTGGTVMNLFDVIEKDKKIKFIMSRHEQGATFMAQGYTRASGKIAPVIATSGPGILNTVTAVADAKMDSLPMLIISGQVPQEVIGTDAFQETDVLGVMYPITKWAVMPDKTSEISKIIAKSLYIATHGRRGPVNIDFAKNLQIDEAEYKKIKTEEIKIKGIKKIPEIKSSDKRIKELKKLIKESQKIIVFVGNGVKISEAQNEVLNFIEKINAPFSFTFHGLSALPSNHPLSVGMMGMHGEIQANRSISEADLIISFGMRFDDRVTGKLSEYAKNAKVVHFDIDWSEIDKNVKTEISFFGDLKQVLKVINQEFKRENFEKNQEWLEKIEDWKKENQENYQKIYARKFKGLSMKKIIEKLSELTEGKDNIVTDVGQHQMFAAKFYNFNKFNSWFSSGGLGTMGFGLPTSIGVKIARPKEEVWMIVGDGSFQMNIQELATLKQENLKINILILNNSYLGMVRQWQDLFFNKHHAATPISSPNYQKIAEAYDLDYQKIEKENDIETAIKKAQKNSKANIIEFICDPEELVLPMIPSANPISKIIKNENERK